MLKRTDSEIQAAACGVPLAAVTAVVVTHVHHDHHGLSGAVRKRTGAWIGMHEREDALLAAFARPGARRSRTAAYLRWDELSASQHRAALGEVVAHLRHLRSRRLVTCADAGGVGLWTPPVVAQAS
jgi:glyoxylase-like metal-dependent hydrolase (beta-lactamase superfamily II)